MVKRYVRSALLAGGVTTVGPTVMEKLEHWIAGGHAVSVRALVARRAAMALMFRTVKEQRQ